MPHLKLSCLLVSSVATLALAACIDPVGAADPDSSAVTTQTQAARSTARVVFQGGIITDFAVPLGCTSLNGSAFIPDLSGHTGGYQFSNSDCHWSSATQQCDCTVSITQLSH